MLTQHDLNTIASHLTAIALTVRMASAPPGEGPPRHRRPPYAREPEDVLMPRVRAALVNRQAVTMVQIAEALAVPVSHVDRSTATRWGLILAALGWLPSRVRASDGTRLRVYRPAAP